MTPSPTKPSARKVKHRHRYSLVGGYKNELSCLNKTITYEYCKCGARKP